MHVEKKSLTKKYHFKQFIQDIFYVLHEDKQLDEEHKIYERLNNFV